MLSFAGSFHFCPFIIYPHTMKFGAKYFCCLYALFFCLFLILNWPNDLQIQPKRDSASPCVCAERTIVTEKLCICQQTGGRYEGKKPSCMRKGKWRENVVRCDNCIRTLKVIMITTWLGHATNYTPGKWGVNCNFCEKKRSLFCVNCSLRRATQRIFGNNKTEKIFSIVLEEATENTKIIFIDVKLNTLKSNELYEQNDTEWNHHRKANDNNISITFRN